MSTTKDLQRQQTQKRVQRYRKRQKALHGIVPFVTPDLPPERIEGIKAILVSRKRMGCPDDSKARWQRALDYRVWELAQ